MVFGFVWARQFAVFGSLQPKGLVASVFASLALLAWEAASMAAEVRPGRSRRDPRVVDAVAAAAAT